MKTHNNPPSPEDQSRSITEQFTSFIGYIGAQIAVFPHPVSFHAYQEARNARLQQATEQPPVDHES